MDHVFGLVFNSDNSDIRKIRRVLQENYACAQPSTAELSFFVTFLLVEAETTCTTEGITLSDVEWEKAAYDLVQVFAAAQCWGMPESDCDDVVDDAIAFDDDTTLINLIPKEDVRIELRGKLSDDGTRCDFEDAPATERDIDLTYLYRVETASNDETAILDSIEGIERALVVLPCNGAERRRSLEDIGVHVVAIDSSPLDTISTECE